MQAAVIVGWPLVAALLVTAGIAFAPVRIRRSARLIVWLLAAVSIVIVGLVLEQGQEQPVGVWPWAAAAALSPLITSAPAGSAWRASPRR